MSLFFQKILILLFFSLLYVNLFAQETKEDKLRILLMSGRYFEAKDFYECVEKDSVFVPFYSLYYKYEMAKMQYKNDSAAIYLEELFVDCDEYWGGYKFYYYEQLLDLYTYKLQDYPKALYTCERMLQYLEENPFGVDEENIQNGLLMVQDSKKRILKREKYPTIKIRNKGTKNKVKMKNNEEFIFFDATYNNKVASTLFDTGVSAHLMMNEKMADSMGLKKVRVFDDQHIHQINGKKTFLDERIVDSIEIASAKFYNIPVFVYKLDPTLNIPDSIQNLSTEAKESLSEQLGDASKMMSIIMGYPMMFLLERVMIDFKNNELSFPNDHTITVGEMNKPNLFIQTPNLYTRLFFNDIPLTAHLDLGSSSYMQIHSSFYEKNKDEIPIMRMDKKEPLNISMIHNTWLNIPYEIPENPILKFNERVIPCNENNLIQIYSLPNEQIQATYDGHVGYPFLRDLGKKILLDFDNMRLEIIE